MLIFQNLFRGKRLKICQMKDGKYYWIKKIPKELKQTFNKKEEEIIGKSDITDLTEDEEVEKEQEINR